jgi:hypothetical protein
MRSLRDAYDCALEMKRSRWEFAVEIAFLRDSGLNATDLRWLLAKGFAEHAVETTRPAAPSRRFRPINSMALPLRTCLVLTAAGAEFFDGAPIARLNAGIHPIVKEGEANDRLNRNCPVSPLRASLGTDFRESAWAVDRKSAGRCLSLPSAACRLRRQFSRSLSILCPECRSGTADVANCGWAIASSSDSSAMLRFRN